MTSEDGDVDSAARAARIATLDWPALRDEVAACHACALCETRRQTVFGVGAADARWMVVGEAPGEQEDRQGAPFVGPAGRLLDQMLA
ncbi:MAG TPA: uracil-DNA glycosylase family protein, partial [Rubrivivax sp.]|nr:uracil-DNA glycosylase family protein [Rubrivivax sp.]